jgi:FkbM family methyltransferase
MMISYAQNFEDVMLERAFAEIENGFYVDVGAWDPDLDSVTRYFYERGWRGVNIEPNPKYLALLKEKRARDVNLGLAVGAHNGRAVITLIHGTGMSTLHPDIAEGHAKFNFEQEQLDVEMRTLNSVFKEHSAATTHFLKIDCEGEEANVINAFDLRKYRPWIILVESTKPLSREETHADWEPHLLSNDYEFAYFDGVNRFYLAAEHADLKRHFIIPPNVFDDFLVARMMIPAPSGDNSDNRSFLGRIGAFFGSGGRKGK